MFFKIQNANVEHKFGSFQFRVCCPAKYMCKTELPVKSFFTLCSLIHIKYRIVKHMDLNSYKVVCST